MITAIDKKTALILIDLQKGIVGRALAHPIAGLLENSNKLIAAFRQAGLPVVIVNVNPGKAKWTTARKDAQQPAGTPPADGTQIIPELKTEPNDVFITKHTWGAFFETPLHQELQKRGVTGIVIGGIATSIGVEGTARQASELGYNLSFATDAMTDMLTSAHEHSIGAIFPRMGEVGVTEDILKRVQNL